MSNPISEAELAEWEALLAKATPGPWRFNKPESWWKSIPFIQPSELEFDYDDVQHEKVVVDASLIVTLRNNAERIFAALRGCLSTETFSDSTVQLTFSKEKERVCECEFATQPLTMRSDETTDAMHVTFCPWCGGKRKA